MICRVRYHNYMNYELAKQLKEAGFPMLRDICAHWFFNNDGEKFYYLNGWDNESDGNPFDMYWCPSLEELIEACGTTYEDETWGEAVFSLSFGRDTWYAMFDVCDYQPSKDLFSEGTTPSEAVAKLWLALNRPV